MGKGSQVKTSERGYGGGGGGALENLVREQKSWKGRRIMIDAVRSPGIRGKGKGWGVPVASRGRGTCLEKGEEKKQRRAQKAPRRGMGKKCGNKNSEIVREMFRGKKALIKGVVRGRQGGSIGGGEESGGSGS